MSHDSFKNHTQNNPKIITGFLSHLQEVPIFKIIILTLFKATDQIFWLYLDTK